MSASDLTSKRIISMIKKSGLSQEEFAKAIGTSPTTVRRYQHGLVPVNVRIREALLRFEHKLKEGNVIAEDAATEMEAFDDVADDEIPHMTMHTLRRLVDDAKLPRDEIAERIGVSKATLDNWISGRNTPSVHKLEGLHGFWREVYGKGEPKAAGTEPVEEETASGFSEEASSEVDQTKSDETPRRRHRLVAVNRVAEVTTEFFTVHQQNYNRSYSNDVLTFIEKKTNIDRSQLRLVISYWAALMKERFMTLEEAMAVVMGIED